MVDVLNIRIWLYLQCPRNYVIRLLILFEIV